MSNPNLQKRKFSYQWVIVAISILMVFTVLGFCSSSKSLFIVPICEALGISRSALAVNDSCRFITTAVINLFFGALVARFGMKKLILAGFGCLIASSFIYSVAENVYTFYVGGVLLGLGIAWTTTTMVGAVVTRWCKRNRGTIMGVVLASNGVGAALAIQILSPMIYAQGQPFGYRNAYRLVCVILLAVAVLVAIFFRNEPKEEPAEEAPAVQKKKRGSAWAGIPYAEALRKWYFYAALVCIFLTGVVLQGITGISVPHMQDVGIDPVVVTNILSIHTIALTVFKTLIGVIYDRFGLRLTANLSFGTAVVVFLLLANVSVSALGMTFAVLFCVFSALALPLETVMLPIFAGDLFGEHSYNKILGLIASANTAGYAVGAPIANLCYDLLGSYEVAIYAGSGLIFVVMLVMQAVMAKANRERERIEQALPSLD